MGNMVRRIRNGTTKKAIRETVRSGLRDAFFVGRLCLKASGRLGAILGTVSGGLYAVSFGHAAGLLRWLVNWCLGVIAGGLCGTVLGVLVGTALALLMGSLVVVGAGTEIFIRSGVAPPTALRTGAPGEMTPAAAPQGRGSESSPAS
jgi:hypothetical protein